VTRILFEDTHEEPLAGYNTLKVEDDHGELLVEAHLAPEIVLRLDEMLTDAETWDELATIASAYADVFDEDGGAA